MIVALSVVVLRHRRRAIANRYDDGNDESMGDSEKIQTHTTFNSLSFNNYNNNNRPLSEEDEEKDNNNNNDDDDEFMMGQKPDCRSSLCHASQIDQEERKPDEP